MDNASRDLAARIVAALVNANLHYVGHDQGAGEEITRAVLRESDGATPETKARRIIDSLDEVDLLVEPLDAIKARGVVFAELTRIEAGTLVQRNMMTGVLEPATPVGEAVRVDPPDLATGQQDTPVDVFALRHVDESRYVAWCLDRKDALTLERAHGPERCIIDRATIVSVDQDTPRTPAPLDPNLQRAQDASDGMAADQRSHRAAVREEAEAFADRAMAHLGVPPEVVPLRAARRVVVDAFVAGDRRARFEAAAARSLEQHRDTFARLAEVERTERAVVLSDADRALLIEACERAEGESYRHEPEEEARREGWLRLVERLKDGAENKG